MTSLSATSSRSRPTVATEPVVVETTRQAAESPAPATPTVSRALAAESSAPPRRPTAETAQDAQRMQRHSLSAGFMQSRIAQSLDNKTQAGRAAVSTDDTAKAEQRVASGNTVQNKTFNAASLQSDMSARKEFVSGMTQIDGDKNTSMDSNTCGPMAMIGGMMLKDPSSVQKLAGKLKDDKLVQKDPACRAAFERMSSGKYTPADARMLAEVMSRKYINVKNGASNDEMMKLVGKTRELIGNDMPDMVLHRYTDTKNPKGGSHWQAYSNGVEYDPWPGDDGKAVLTEGSAGLAHGGGHYDNGGVHSKIFVKEHGKKLSVERYTGWDANGTVHSHQHKPVATYEYEQKDWFGSNYTRTSGSGVTLDPKEEPGRSPTDTTVDV